MGAYLYIAKMKLLVFLTYRFEVLTSLGTNLIMLMANIYLWKNAYRGGGLVSGVSETQMLTYSIVSVLLSSFFSTNVENIVQERIAQGNIALDFFRPVNVVLGYLAEDVGISLSSVISKLIPLLIISSFFIQTPLPANPAALLLFLISCIFSYLLLWFISALIAALCFWFIQLGELKTIKDGIILLLSGKIIPIWLFPKGIQDILVFLPFKYVYQTPLSIYIDKLPPKEIIFSLSIQVTWIILFALLSSMLWNKARKHILIQGG